MLVAHRQIVERRRVGRVDLRGPLPAVQRLFPQAALRDGDAELHLGLGVRPRVGVGDAGEGRQKQDDR